MLLATCLLASALAPQAAQAASVADAVRAFDWASIDVNSRIPAWMPALQSTDPLEAGFAREWIEHALTPPERPLALAIASTRRAPDDGWAASMEEELRTIIHQKLDSRTLGTQKPTISRAFCNSIGCLCYVEYGEPLRDPPSVAELLLADGAEMYGIRREDLNLVRTTKAGDMRFYAWELTSVKRPPGR